MGFLEEGTAGANSHQDRDGWKSHMQCASQREREGAPEDFENQDGCLSQGEWGSRWNSFLE